MTDWTLTLSGGPRDGDRLTTSDLLPFLVFTTGAEDGTTVDHYYGPTAVDRGAFTATYEPVDTPDNALASVWLQGLRHALEWVGHAGWVDVMAKDNPYGRAK